METGKEDDKPIGEDERERKLRFKQKVLDEIVKSEENYVAQLDLLLDGFVRPVKEKNLLNKSSFSAIFGDIKTLKSLNATLFEELKTGDNVGSCFLKIAPYLKLYSTYAHDYELAISSLQNLRKTNKDFEAFVSQQERLPHICRKLEALLIVPIQRVPRYRLLLAELISYSDPEELDVLNAALGQVEAVARHINEQIRDQENMQRMIRIQRSLSHGKPRILIPGRRFIKEGSLKKVSAEGDSAHQRHFVLFNDMLLYCKLRCGHLDSTQKGSLVCCCVLPLRHCRAEAVVGDGLFKVTCRGEEELLLCSSTADEGRSWVESINAAVGQLEANLRTLRKESSSRRPLRKRQLRQSESNSLMRRFQQKRAAAAVVDVEVLRSSTPPPPTKTPHPSAGSPSVRSSNNCDSPRSIKLPKWPSPCPGTPTFPYCSPRKLLKGSSPVKESPPMFYSPPIQTDI